MPCSVARRSPALLLFAALPSLAAAGTGLPTAPDQTLTLLGAIGSERYGWDVANAGDVNGDGYQDVIVGAHGLDSVGGALLYLGSASGLDTTPAITLLGSASGDQFGYAVGGGGDVNGDGYDDVIVGAYGASEVNVYYGSASGLDATAYTTLSGGASTSFGWSVATAGDVNADGYDDVVVGAIREDGSRGTAWVFLGSATGIDPTPIEAFHGATAYSLAGYAVAGAGDVNGDGYDDVLIGVPVSGGTPFGALVPGDAAGLDTSAAITVSGPSGGGYAQTVSIVGDLNGDGYADITIGAPTFDDGNGRVYLYYGGRSGPSSSPDLILYGYGPVNGNLGAAMEHGDLTGDGLDELFVGGSFENDQLGRVYVHPGDPAGVSSTALAYVEGSNRAAWFAYSIAVADVTGDGVPDLVVGANRDPLFGSVFVYFGVRDEDNDGWNSPGDCDDGDDTIHPDADEQCDGVDNNCDGLVDDESAVDPRDWLPDGDADGWTAETGAVSACAAPSGYLEATASPDCDDADASVYPGAPEIADDGVDQDCDGLDLVGGGDDTGGPADSSPPEDSGAQDTAIRDTGEPGKPGGCGCATGGAGGAGWIGLGLGLAMRRRRRNS